MRILFLPSSYLPQTVGGTEVYVHRLADALGRRGVEVTVAHHPVASSPGESFLPERVVALGPLKQPRRAELYGMSLRESPPGFVRLLEAFQPDLIHFHSLSLGAGPDHAREVKQRGIPYVVTYHLAGMSCPTGSLWREGRSLCDGVLEKEKCATCMLSHQGLPLPLARVLGRSSLRADRFPDWPWIQNMAMPDLLERRKENWLDLMTGAGHIIACADWCAEVLRANGIEPGKISVMRPALPGTSRRVTLRQPDPKSGPLVLGHFGRISRVKGWEVFIRGVEELSSRGIKCRGELVGPMLPGERRALERAIAASGKILYRGVKDEGQVREWLTGIDITALPGLIPETGPLVLLESWGQGVPVVGTNLGGTRDFLEGQRQSHCLFERNDPKGLADSVMRVMSLGAQTVEIPGVEDLADKTLALYESMVPKIALKRSR